MTTRSKNGICRPKVFLNEYLDVEPIIVKEALRCPHWLQAMKNEYSALLKNNTWSLVSQPFDHKIIGCKWVFKIKRNFDGSISRYKASLVAKGFHQVADADYTETFSPVVKPVTIRVLLTYTLANGWSIHQLDIHNAFLHGVLHEDVFMEQPHGFATSTDIPLVCKLHKALYGLRAWFERLSTFLLSIGFQSSRADPSLLFRRRGTSQSYILIYVDDIVVTGSSVAKITNIITLLHKQFALKNLGILSYFLGIEVSYPKQGGLFLSQAKYITDLLHKA